MLRTVIYIDGQNLHYQLTNLRLLEKDINWENVFKDIVGINRLIRAYWYQAARVAPWEWNPRFHTRFCPPDMSQDDFERKAKEYYKNERERLDNLHRQVYTRIEENFPSVEFRYAGVLKVNPTKWSRDNSGSYRIGSRVGEKGVDVAMAVDMVRQASDYEVAVIVSGDFDFLPAIQAVKDRLRRVEVVSIMKGSPPKHQGQARRLRSLCDVQHHIYETDLKGKYKFP